MNMRFGRRQLLKYLGIGAGAAGISAITRSPGIRAQEATENAAALTDWQLMDQHHQEGVTTFLNHIGQDPNFWPQELEYTLDGDVKVFELTCQAVDWETTTGMVFPAYTYNGRVPGPTIRVTEGDRVRINVTNELPESTAIHFHGLLIPNDQDGVPFVTQPVIPPGTTYTYEFTTRNAGTHMYHSHHNAAEQVTRGLLGGFIIDPLDTSREPEVSADYVFVLNDSSLGFTINGKSFPHTQPIAAKLGDKIRIRYMNEGLMIHPMHLHGIPQLVFAKDGFYLPVPFMCDTLNIAPGERYDVLVDCTEPGLWAFHCHILNHAESRNGMFGMVTVLSVTE